MQRILAEHWVAPLRGCKHSEQAQRECGQRRGAVEQCSGARGEGASKVEGAVTARMVADTWENLSEPLIAILKECR